MEKLVQALCNINIRKNEGYIFLKKDEVFVPFVKTILSITKRSFYALPLLDEIVLRLINEGVQDVDELVNVLGIDRMILEVTLADLSVKDIIYCTANRSSLMAKGKKALDELRTIQRRKDIIKNVFFDPVNKKVLEEHEKYQFLDNVYNYDKKMDADFEINDISVFRENINSVNKIFESEMNIYNDKTKSEIDELLSVDFIENVFAKFVRIPIYIYVSNTGYDIDILAVNSNDEQLLVQYKDEIIDQIRKRKILKKTFVKYGLRGDYFVPQFEENKELQDMLEKYKRCREDRDVIVSALEKLIFCNRKLRDEEFESLLIYLTDECTEIKIGVSHLDDWAKHEHSVKILPIVAGKLKETYYTKCNDYKRTLSLLQKITPHYKNGIVAQRDDSYFFSITFDNKYNIIGVPRDIQVIDNGTHVHKMDYYLKMEIEADEKLDIG